MSKLPEIEQFLLCSTPDSWINLALENQDTLLIDHANCEKKAASTALNLMYRYIDRDNLLFRMSRLAREELRHFEQVLKIMKQRGIAYRHVSPSRYAGSLRDELSPQDPQRLVDTLVVGALIEARSCERFARLSPHLDQQLREFYRSLLSSEARHFQDYLKLAMEYSNGDLDSVIERFARLEQHLIESPDQEFRFHSGASLQQAVIAQV